jgi:hypothetical protein
LTNNSLAASIISCRSISFCLSLRCFNPNPRFNLTLSIQFEVKIYYCLIMLVSIC